MLSKYEVIPFTLGIRFSRSTLYLKSIPFVLFSHLYIPFSLSSFLLLLPPDRFGLGDF